MSVTCRGVRGLLSEFRILLLLYCTRFSVKVWEVQKEFQVADPGGTLGLDEPPSRIPSRYKINRRLLR